MRNGHDTAAADLAGTYPASPGWREPTTTRHRAEQGNEIAVLRRESCNLQGGLAERTQIEHALFAERARIDPTSIESDTVGSERRV